MKRTLCFLLALSLVFCLFGCGEGSQGATTVGETDTQVVDDTTPAENTRETVFYVGDTLTSNNMKMTYVASGEHKESNQFLQPKDGNQYIYLTFYVENVAAKSDAHISTFDFSCYADGYACDQYYGGENDLSATLSAGRSTTGSVYFEIPVNAEEVEIEYETNWLSSEKVTFVYEGEKDSGFVAEKNAVSSDGALSVGQSATSNSLIINYLACYRDSSDNMFITPQNGHHYVTCEFEFENTSNSDQYISSFSFDCYADGRACEQAYIRDDAINSTLSSGRKAKGTVTFEIPDDASVVEVEYLSDFWTSNRVVFDASGR